MSWRIFYARPSSCLDWLLIWDHPHVLGHFSYGRSPSCFVSYFLWETSIMGDHALSWTAMNFIIIPIFIFWKTPVLSNNILFVGKTLDSQDRFYCTSCFLKKNNIYRELRLREYWHHHTVIWHLDISLIWTGIPLASWSYQCIHL